MQSPRYATSLLMLVSLLIVAAANEACGQAVCPHEPVTSLECARQFFAGHQFEAAEFSARQYLAGHQDSADAMFLLGHVLEARKNATESLKWFTKAAALRRPTGEDIRVVAMDYVLLNDYADADRWLTQSVQMDPNNAEAWYDLGRARMMLGDMQGARAPLERSLQLQPRQAKVENNLGVVDEAQNQPVEAAAAYRRAIEWQEASPNRNEQPLLNLGTLLTTQQKASEALPLLLEAARIAPGDPKCNEALAKAEEQLGDLTHAVEHLSRAVALDPKSARLHYELGQLYRHAGQPENAKRELALSGKLYGPHSTDAER